MALRAGAQCVGHLTASHHRAVSRSRDTRTAQVEVAATVRAQAHQPYSRELTSTAPGQESRPGHRQRSSAAGRGAKRELSPCGVESRRLYRRQKRVRRSHGDTTTLVRRPCGIWRSAETRRAARIGCISRRCGRSSTPSACDDWPWLWMRSMRVPVRRDPLSLSLSLSLSPLSITRGSGSSGEK